MIIDKSSKQIICTAFEKGRKHDFRLFKESKSAMHTDTKCEADTGYQGLARLHANSAIPTKRSKKKPLSKQDKEQNYRLSSSRVLIENVIREVKIFRIIAERYRNRRKRFGLRFNLIAAICNLNRTP